MYEIPRQVDTLKSRRYGSACKVHTRPGSREWRHYPASERHVREASMGAASAATKRQSDAGEVGESPTLTRNCKRAKKLAREPGCLASPVPKVWRGNPHTLCA